MKLLLPKSILPLESMKQAINVVKHEPETDELKKTETDPPVEEATDETEKTETELVDEEEDDSEDNLEVENDENDTIDIHMDGDETPSSTIENLMRTSTLKELRTKCKQLGLNQMGKKIELANRICESNNDTEDIVTVE